LALLALGVLGCDDEPACKTEIECPPCIYFTKGQDGTWSEKVEGEYVTSSRFVGCRSEGPDDGDGGEEQQ